MKFSNEEIIQFLQSKTGSEVLFEVDRYNVIQAEIPVHQLYKTMNLLFKDLEFKISNLIDLCGIHYPENKGKELGVVYHLQSLQYKILLRLKVFVPIEKPDVPSITGIYAAANWMERETYDFYGINFLGHPDLRRILNMDEMVDFPMRKEFPLEDPFREDKADFHFGR
ncbi:MAG: NADH-quinone oxidoreductase subunit C [Saprospiraceae bacterium]|nr:NADH-quinone oxidoreductase subunit C [Saprospiraceae bacterium]